MNTCFLLVKQAVALVSFPIALGTSAGSRRCCVTSPGSRVGIAELMLLVPRCYGFGTVLDSSDGWFQGESPADRLPGCPCAELEGELREQEESPGAQERELHTGALF